MRPCAHDVRKCLVSAHDTVAKLHSIFCAVAHIKGAAAHPHL